MHADTARPDDDARALPPAGWYPDPGTGQPRWWDGTAWTERFR